MAASEPPRREGRRHGVPPTPPARQEFDVLKNVDGALGTALWQALRNVHLWAATPPERRAGLFHPINENVRERLAAARLTAPELADALGTFACVQGAPTTVEPRHLAAACHAVYEWADRSSLLATALHFAEAAAYADPGSATWAVDAAWMCRKVGGASLSHRSGAWYLRAFALAVRARDREEALRALTGYGALMKDLGRVDEARTAYERAARRAMRTGRRRRAAVALHYLFSLAVETGTPAEAESYARRALSLYPLHDARLPYLAADFAFLLVRQRHYVLALQLLDLAADRLDRADEMGLLLGTTAWAAGGANRPERYRLAERAALELTAVNEEYAAASLVCMAEGARSLGDWERAERYTRAGLEIARRRVEPEAERIAVGLLDALERREPGAPPVDLPADAPTAVFARRLAARLRRWRRRGRGIRPARYCSEQGSVPE